MAARKKKTWQEKLAHEKDLPKVIQLTDKEAQRWGGRTLAVPRPRDVDAFMRKVPKGKLITIAELRKNVAKQHAADSGGHIGTQNPHIRRRVSDVCHHGTHRGFKFKR